MRFSTLACMLVAGLALASDAAPQAEPGVTPISILVGGTAPLSGGASTAASVALGADAYFRYVNGRGGVHGRAIHYRYLDDAGDPAQTAHAARQLVEQDRVFAFFNSVGAEPNRAIRPYLNANGVPHLFVASGETALASSGARHPWSIGFRPSYRTEGRVYGAFLARTRPASRVAVLFANDALGKELLGGLERGLARSRARVVAAEPVVDSLPDVRTQVATLRASGADTLALFVGPAHAIQAYAAARTLRWRPFVIVNAASSSARVLKAAVGAAGAVSATFLKDPTDPRWKNDSGIRLYRSIMARYARNARVDDLHHVYGMAAAFTLVEAVERAGRDLTRAGVMRAAGRLVVADNPFLLPGVVVRTGAGDRSPVEQLMLQRWQGRRWGSFGGLWSTHER
jgi:branched-chain amino acid transport system substrate-binding protein